uniref:Phage protein n=1 Tax=Pectobacterium carotovorum TaxID=554 RepID=A0A0K0MNL3_PECCA|nr:hypothetical protein [Pectobacterium carotovorum]AKG47496.1 hypothetical protein pA_00056 [Pectobacterium carotovorum]
MNTRISIIRDKKTMPYVIPDTDADFNTKLKAPEKNIDYTRLFLQSGVEDFVLPGFVTPHGYRFVKSKTDDQYRLIAMGENPETVYLVQLRFRNDIVYGKTTCTQIKVWRTISAKHNEVVHNLPRTFFTNLLKKHSIVVSDEEQTGDGKRFWETMIDWAMSSGFYVYVSDGTEEDRPLSKITDMGEFYDKWDDFCWGNDREVHTHRLAVISLNNIV